MKPILTRASNTVYHAPPSMPECAPLHCQQTADGRVVSVWKLSYQERHAIFYENENIELHVWAQPTPPVALQLTKLQEITEVKGIPTTPTSVEDLLKADAERRLGPDPCVAVKAEPETMEQKVARLEKFKKYVHDTLDALGIDKCHGADADHAGHCRIHRRLEKVRQYFYANPLKPGGWGEQSKPGVPLPHPEPNRPKPVG